MKMGIVPTLISPCFSSKGLVGKSPIHQDLSCVQIIHELTCSFNLEYFFILFLFSLKVPITDRKSVV